MLIRSRAKRRDASKLTVEQMEALPSPSAESMERVYAGFAARAGLKPDWWKAAPTQREPMRLMTSWPVRSELEEHQRLVVNQPVARWNRAWVGIAATIALALFGREGWQLAWVAPHAAQIEQQTVGEDAYLGT